MLTNIIKIEVSRCITESILNQGFTDMSTLRIVLICFLVLPTVKLRQRNYKQRNHNMPQFFLNIHVCLANTWKAHQPPLSPFLMAIKARQG